MVPGSRVDVLHTRWMYTIGLLSLLMSWGCRDNPVHTDRGTPTDEDVGVYEGKAIELQIDHPDDFVFVDVNGIRKETWRYAADNPPKSDITSWFGSEVDTLGFTVVNSGGPANFRIRVWVDDVPVFERNCTDLGNGCITGADGDVGIVFTDQILLNIGGTGARRVAFNNPPGALYINNQYSGYRTPTTLSLPYGEYRVGIGTDGVEPRYYETDLTVDDQIETVNLGASAVRVSKNWKMGLLPIRVTQHGNDAAGNIGILTETEINAFEKRLQATNSELVRPFSYHLIDWDVTRLPIVEDDTLFRGPDPVDYPDTGRLMEEAGLTHLFEEFDTIVFFYAHKQENGQNVFNMPCCLWGGGQGMAITYYSTSLPDEGLLHEWLHSVESYNSWFRYGNYNGINALHGAGVHGYYENENGWKDWYRVYMRSQVKEIEEMDSDLQYPVIPSEADLFVGVFYTIRYGPYGPMPYPELNRIEKPPSILHEPLKP